MQNLSVSWQEHEKLQVGEALKKLFTLQDRPMTKEKEAILTDELSLSGLPVGAVISGINSLKSEDVSTIKLSTLLSASRKFVEQREEPDSECGMCLKGIVVMKDEAGYEFALSCQCQMGLGHKGYVQWNGENIQHSRGRYLRKVF